MSQTEKALIAWMELAIGERIEKTEELRNPKYFSELCRKIKGFNHISFS